MPIVILQYLYSLQLKRDSQKKNFKRNVSTRTRFIVIVADVPSGYSPSFIVALPRIILEEAEYLENATLWNKSSVFNKMSGRATFLPV
jgi:hypothetical protein